VTSVCHGSNPTCGAGCPTNTTTCQTTCCLRNCDYYWQQNPSVCGTQLDNGCGGTIDCSSCDFNTGGAFCTASPGGTGTCSCPNPGPDGTHCADGYPADCGKTWTVQCAPGYSHITGVGSCYNDAAHGCTGGGG
jgi:hypothetical protein